MVFAYFPTEFLLYEYGDRYCDCDSAFLVSRGSFFIIHYGLPGNDSTRKLNVVGSD